MLEGIVRNGVIVPDTPAELEEGARVRIEVIVAPEPTFGQLFGDLCIQSDELPTDLAATHGRHA
jgi:predicted DNA-binding antitoxin AbrB/MazE fold protein